MKKFLPYIIGFIVVMLIAIIWISSGKIFDERITLSRKDKIPYGCYVAYNNLSYLFPAANISVNSRSPEDWDSSIINSNHQVLLVVTKEFNAENSELTELFHFVEKGNDVFISTNEFSRDALDFFHINSTGNLFEYLGAAIGGDSMKLSLMQPPFPKGSSFFEYPGKRTQGSFSTFDSSMTYILGTTLDSLPEFVKFRKVDSLPMFIKIRAGQGNFYLHHTPIALSNYFLLHKNNLKYYEQVMSLMDPKAIKVSWDEYYLHKAKQAAKESSPLRVLLTQEGFRWALYLAVTSLLVFVLLGLKRRQRIIPVILPPQNDSLDFVKTVGRLYFQKRDNKNLCQKMATYFTEHIFNRYKIHSGNLDSQFEKVLVQKSGSDEQTIHRITEYIKFFQGNPPVHDQQVIEFYQLLNKFYKTS
ncbi:MAG: hypothetical protein C5B52_06055 [Bacteroidetes bacterium]|nr:MAG: hypothetical protein C5B52_06055 [Bacteroidota bacterium]